MFLGKLTRCSKFLTKEAADTVMSCMMSAGYFSNLFVKELTMLRLDFSRGIVYCSICSTSLNDFIQFCVVTSKYVVGSLTHVL